jgi:hypothetical protein
MTVSTLSTRSDLPWDESVRLDLSYVDNWSMASDLLLIAKPLKAVLASDGAYLMARGEFAPGGLRVVAAWAANGPDHGRRQRRSTDGQHGDRSRQSADSGLAASQVADRVIRELDWASLKHPDHGVPPPRSGLPRLGVT